MKKLLTKALVAVLFAAGMGLKSLHAADWYNIYETTTTDSATTIFEGAGYLYKIIVSSAGNGSFLTVADYDDSLGTPEIAGLDTASAGEYIYKVGISSGLTYRTDANTDPAAIQILYRRGTFYPSDGLVFRSSFTTTAEADANLFDGAGMLYKIIVSSGATAGAATDIFNSYANDTGEDTRILRANGAAALDDTYNVVVSSGLTYTNTTADVGRTIIYRKGVTGR